jgi:hypothetical protein
VTPLVVPTIAFPDCQNQRKNCQKAPVMKNPRGQLLRDG